jgi:DNA-directed RNA polymerase specialized sigma24 family protein
MFRWKKDQDLREQAEEYASHYDFREIFTEDEAGLRLLALLLTGDRQRAEQCLVQGLNRDNESKDNVAFRDWAHSWSKRAIIKNAIQAVNPSPRQANGHPRGSSAKLPRTLAGAVSRLEAFERFVFIMSLVEGYALQECATLLGVSPQEVTLAKSRAVEHVASMLPAEESVPTPVNAFLREKTA